MPKKINEFAKTREYPLWGAQATSLLSSAACRRPFHALKKLLSPNVQRAFRQAAEKDRFATANPSCGGLAAGAPQEIE
jgi:hypothetical protein